MLHTKQTAFTLVELIVVVTILAILATIGFVSYSSYLTGVRDTNRLAQLVSIHDGLTLYSTTKDLPLPDDNVEVKIGTGTIAYQGYAGSNTLETIDFTKGGKDPRDGEYFSYYLSEDRKYFQLMAFLEEEANITSYSPITPSPLRRGLGGGFAHATDYSERIPTIYGKKLGILTDNSNTPIQDIPLISSAGELDIQASEDTSGYVAHFNDTSRIQGTATDSPLQYMGSVSELGGTISINCKQLLAKKSSLTGKDGIYILSPDGMDTFPAYCDMTTDGGGWTLIASNGLTEITEPLPNVGTTPTPDSGGLVMYFVENRMKDFATEMRVVNVTDESDNYTYDLTPAWLKDLTLINSGHGYMYASDTGFSGGLPGVHKGNIALIYPTPGSYPADGKVSGGNAGTANSGYGSVAYAWQFKGEGDWFRVGWNVPTSITSYYNTRNPAYLMIR